MAQRRKKPKRSAAKPKKAPPAGPPRKRGGQTVRTRELEEQLLAWIADGGTLRAFCRQPGMPSHVTVHEWRKADRQFAERLARARELGADQIAEEILEIVDTPQVGEIVTEESVTLEGEGGADVPGTKRTVRTEDMLGHRKLRVETRMKLLKVWFPDRYGDRVDVDHKSGGKSFDELLRGVLGTDDKA